MIRTSARWLWRGCSHLLTGLLVLLFLLWLLLVALASTPAGSRWLLERLLSLQSAVRADGVHGTLRDGLVIDRLRVQAKTFHILAEKVVLRVRWAGLLAGDLRIEELQAEHARIVYEHPPNTLPVHLKRLYLPIRLSVDQGCLNAPALVRTTGVTDAGRLCVSGASWSGTTLHVGEAELLHPAFRLAASGRMDFKDHYPLSAHGLLTAGLFARHAIPGAEVTASGDLATLALLLVSARPSPIMVAGTLDTLAHELPYHGVMRWGDQNIAWLPQLELHSREGEALFRGDRHGLTVSAHADLQGPFFPSGEYRALASTDWRSLTLKPLEARTATGGVARVTGQVGWVKGLTWNLDSAWSQVDLSRVWSGLSPWLNPLDGRLVTEGNASAQGSRLTAKGDWTGGEHWAGALESTGWPWQGETWKTAHAGWTGIRRVFPGIGAIQTDSGALDWRGPLQDGDFTVDAHFASAAAPSGQWQGAGHARPGLLSLSSLVYDGEAGGLAASGLIRHGNGLQGNLSLNLTGFRSNHWLPDWPATLSGPVTVTGEWGASGKQANLTDMQLTGVLKDKPLAVAGNLRILPRADGLPDFAGQGLQLDWGDDHLVVEGGRDDRAWDLTLDARFQDMALLDARVTGAMSGTVQIQGERERPAVALNLLGEKIGTAAGSVETVSLSGIVPELAEQGGFLQLHAHGMTRGDRTLDDFTAVLQGTRKAHTLSWQLDAGPTLAEGVLSGGLSDTLDWKGESTDSTIRMRDFLWAQQGPFAIDWTRATETLTAAPQCWQAESARLCNTETLIASPRLAHARAGLDGLEINRMSAVFPEGLAWNGSLEGTAAFDWAEGNRPELSGRLVTRHGAIGLAQEEDEPLTLPYDQLSLSLATEGEQFHIRFDTAAPNIGQGYVDTWVNPTVQPNTVSGALVLDKVNVAVFKPFFPGLSRLEGELNLAGGLSGPVDSPDFYGEFNFRNGALATRDAPVDLDRIGVAAAIRGRQASITGGFHSGDGEAKLDGRMAWSGTPELDMHVGGQSLAVRQKPLVNALIDPDVSVTVKPYQLTVKGKVEVPEGELQPQALSDKAIPLSADVHVIDQNANKSRVRLAGAMKQWAVDADLDLILGNKVRFKGFGLNSYLNGRLRLQEQPQRGLQATGEIDIDTRADRDARYEAYGQKLAIRSGRLLFAGPLTQPALNMEAIKTIDDKVVGVRVEGRANAPTVQLFSDTAMTQDEMLGYLLIGRPLYQEGRLNVGSTGSDASLLASAALSLGVKGGQGLASEIGRAHV